MQATPVRMTLPVLADQDAEADASALVAPITKLMEADHLGFDVALRLSRRACAATATTIATPAPNHNAFVIMDVFAPEDVAPPAPIGSEWSTFKDRKPHHD